MILSGGLIKDLEIITPFHDKTIVNGKSFGVGPAGYDVRVEFDEQGKIETKVIYPGDYILASTIERISVPDNVIGFVHDKSSWARVGVAVQNTVMEPGWQGFLTLEISNHSPRSVVLKRGDPIAQLIFHRVEGEVQSYTGKYQNQGRGPVAAIHEKS